jgi:hypothetical protein
MNAILHDRLRRRRLTRRFGVLAALMLVGMLALSGCATQAWRPVPPLPISSIVQQSKAGVPAASIIDQIADSGAVYRLSASQLADLRDQGVADAVINYMQQTYILAARFHQHLLDRNFPFYARNGYGYGYDYDYDRYPYGWP